jgi:hypothetical protein
MLKIFKKEPKPSWYQNPWGMKGGLFGSVTVVFSFVLIYQLEGLNTFYIILISALILAWGYMHSLALSRINDLGAVNFANLSVLTIQNQTIYLLERNIVRQRKLIKELENQIKLLNEALVDKHDR